MERPIDPRPFGEFLEQFHGLARALKTSDVEALMSLYDQTVCCVYGYALSATRSRRRAYDVTRLVFLNVWDEPELLHDCGASYEVQMTMITEQNRCDEPPGFGG